MALGRGAPAPPRELSSLLVDLEGSWSKSARAAIAGRLEALARRRVRPEGVPHEKRSAAVLIPLVDTPAGPGVLFTTRSTNVGTHKGQVSFPGGRRDPDDDSHVDTALRETCEELGLARDRVEVLGRFHEARAITGVRVVPVVGYLGALDIGQLSPSPAEIERVFALDLEALTDPARRSVLTLHDRGDLPVFEAGPDPIWGLTAWILREFLEEGLGMSLAPTRREATMPLPR